MANHFYEPDVKGSPYAHLKGGSPQPMPSRGGRGGRRGNGRRDGAHRQRKALPVVVACVLVVLAVAAVALFLNPPFYEVMVNGNRYTVGSGSTIQTLLDKGYATPKAGNLMAVDGSLAQEGAGNKFTATINGGEPTSDPATKLAKGDDVQVTDGTDATESYQEKTEAVPHGTSSDGNDANYWAGSIHVRSDGQDGEKVVRTGDVSGKTVEEVTKAPVDAGYHVYTTNTKGDKVVALTFDDGPWPTTTGEILDILKENDAKATFFEIGNQIANNADVVRRIHDEGHQIATHTWDHASGSGGGVDITKMSAEEQVSEVQKGFDAIDQAIGTQTPRILRAPGGNYHGQVIDTLKPYVTAEIGWDVDTEDWRRPGADKIAQAILSVQPGGVVLMHDGGGDRSQTVEGLRTALPQLKAQGYRFVTIDELLAYSMPGAGDSGAAATTEAAAQQ